MSTLNSFMLICLSLFLSQSPLRRLLIIIFLGNFFDSSSQKETKFSDFFEKDTSFNIEFRSEFLNLNYLTWSIDFPNLYYISENHSSILFYNLLTKISGEIKFDKKTSKKLKKLYLSKIYLKDNHLIAYAYKKHQKYLLISQLDSSNISEKAQFKSISRTTKIYIDSSGFKFGFCYSSPDENYPFINVNNSHKELKFENYFLTHNLPFNYIDFVDGRSLFSQSSKYEIMIFNDDFSIDTISCFKHNFEGLDSLLVKSIEEKYSPYKPQEIFKELQLLDEKSDRIYSVYFIDSKNILVFWIDNLNIFADFWCYDNREWSLKSENVICNRCNENDLIDKDCFLLNYFNPKIEIKDGKIYTIREGFHMNVEGVNYNDYKNKLNNDALNNSYNYFIDVYNFKD